MEPSATPAEARLLVELATVEVRKDIKVVVRKLVPTGKEDEGEEHYEESTVDVGRGVFATSKMLGGVALIDEESHAAVFTGDLCSWCGAHVNQRILAQRMVDVSNRAKAKAIHKLAELSEKGIEVTHIEDRIAKAMHKAQTDLVTQWSSTGRSAALTVPKGEDPETTACAVRCRWGCSMVLYCSAACAKTGAQNHLVLCPNAPKDAKYAMFFTKQEHADIEAVYGNTKQREELLRVARKRVKKNRRVQCGANSMPALYATRSPTNIGDSLSVLITTLAVEYEVGKVLEPDLPQVLDPHSPFLCTTDQAPLKLWPADMRIENLAPGYVPKDTWRRAKTAVAASALYVRTPLENEVVGHAVSYMSLLNHSCAPTCALVWYGRRARLMTLRPLEPGDELTINYHGDTLIMADAASRREVVRNTILGRDCVCLRCAPPAAAESPCDAWPSHESTLPPELARMRRHMLRKLGRIYGKTKKDKDADNSSDDSSDSSDEEEDEHEEKQTADGVLLTDEDLAMAQKINKAARAAARSPEARALHVRIDFINALGKLSAAADAGEDEARIRVAQDTFECSVVLMNALLVVRSCIDMGQLAHACQVANLLCEALTNLATHQKEEGALTLCHSTMRLRDTVTLMGYVASATAYRQEMDALEREAKHEDTSASVAAGGISEHVIRAALMSISYSYGDTTPLMWPYGRGNLQAPFKPLANIIATLRQKSDEADDSAA